MENYLQKGKHDILEDQIHFISDQTRIPERFIRHVAAKDYCTEEEMAWIRASKKNISDGSLGMILYGHQPKIQNKLLAIGATLVRNYVDARVYSLSELLQLLDARYVEPPDCTVLIVPDLCVSDYVIPKGQVHKLTGYLYKRFAVQKAMIAYVDQIELVGATYGRAMLDHLLTNYPVFTTEAKTLNSCA